MRDTVIPDWNSAGVQSMNPSSSVTGDGVSDLTARSVSLTLSLTSFSLAPVSLGAVCVGDAGEVGDPGAADEAA